METITREDLESLCDGLEAGDAMFEHNVAWIDCSAAGQRLGRGLLSRGNWIDRGGFEPHRDPGRSMPTDRLDGLLNPFTLRAFNSGYYANGRFRAGQRISHYAPFLYPLDSIRDWNRLYGRRGFYQYQCVIPDASGREPIRELLRKISASGEGSFLAVLKRFGDRPSAGMLSFPLPGLTLALDFKNRGECTTQLLAQLDAIVRAAGGRLYAAGRSSLRPADMFRQVAAIQLDYYQAVSIPPVRQSEFCLANATDERAERPGPRRCLDHRRVHLAASTPAEGSRLFLVGRNAERLEAIAADLRVRGATEVVVHAGDLGTIDPADVTAEASTKLGSLDVILLAYGILGDQRECERDLAAAAQMIDINFRSAALWGLAAANQLEKQHSGTLVVIGSVAGDRGRQSNYLYGATKGGLGILVQGIAHRLAASGACHWWCHRLRRYCDDTVAIIGGKGLLWSSPEKIAKLIHRAADSGKQAITCNLELLAASSLTVIAGVPSAIFHRTKL